MFFFGVGYIGTFALVMYIEYIVFKFVYEVFIALRECFQVAVCNRAKERDRVALVKAKWLKVVEEERQRHEHELKVWRAGQGGYRT